MLDCYGPMLDRPVIKDDFEDKYPQLLVMYSDDLDNAKEIYDKQMASIEASEGKPPLNKNMPEVAGALKWSKQLRKRIEHPMSCFKHFEHP